MSGSISRRRFSTTGLTLALILGILAGSTGSAVAAPPERHVVIISVDGLAAYLLDDPKAPIPTIRALAKSGASVDGGMKVSNPSVTWPNHTSMASGFRPEKHGVLANGVIVRGGPGLPMSVDPKRDQADLVRVPMLYDVAHAAGLRTGEINWPCTRGARSLDDSFPDVPENVANSTPRLRRELVAAGILVDETDASFRGNSIVGRDYIWTEAACHVIRERKPNLLYVHLLNVDATHHSQGPQSQPGYTSNAYADACVARILQALEEAGIREQTTVFVVADHGFQMTPKALRPNVIFRQAEMLKTDDAGKIVEARLQVIPEGGIGLVYATVPGARADIEKAKELLAGREGVAEILEPEQFAEHGLPHPREYEQAPDLVLVAKDGYGVSGSAEGEDFVASHTEGRISLGSHGFLASNPKMNATCVISGRGVKPGTIIPQAENIDVAATAARLLGLTNFESDGRVLSEALSETAAKP